MEEDIVDFLTRYSFSLKDECQQHLLCRLCNKIAAHPMNAPCLCVFCKSCIEHYLSNDDRICPGDSDDCQRTFLNLSKDIQFDRRASKKISKLLVKCPHESCLVYYNLKEMVTHVRICDKQSVGCVFLPLGCDQAGLIKRNMDEHCVESNVVHMKLLVESISNLENRLNLMGMELKIEQDRRMSLEGRLKSLEDNERMIENMKQELENEKTIRLSMERNSSLQLDEERSERLSEQKLKVELADPSASVFKWEIKEFTQKCQKLSWIQSEYFYSLEGYKMSLAMQLSSIGRMPIYFRIHKGPSDSRLEWPMPLNVTVAIVDPQSKENCIQWTFSRYNCKWPHNWNKPVDKCNDSVSNIPETSSSFWKSLVATSMNTISNSLYISQCAHSEDDVYLQDILAKEQLLLRNDSVCITCSVTRK